MKLLPQFGEILLVGVGESVVDRGASFKGRRRVLGIISGDSRLISIAGGCCGEIRDRGGRFSPSMVAEVVPMGVTSIVMAESFTPSPPSKDRESDWSSGV